MMEGREFRGKMAPWVHLEAVGREVIQECLGPAIQANLANQAFQELVEAMVRRAGQVT